uniref:Uncharacterized protein n=1 Tax=Daphnia galeata TaxID=27404 RepID=A0A8J2WDF6_9CRUS|nr:unnamed protein product [Daphnia galeata]
MKNVCMIIFASLLVMVLSSPQEPLESSETFTQVYPLAERAFFYYPNGAGGYLNRGGNPASSVDFADNPFETAAGSSSQDMVLNPAAYFVPTSDLLAMPYPSKIDQETDERAAMKHLEMLKELHDQLENSEQKFLKPSLSFGGNGVTLPMNAFVSMLHKLSKTITKTVTTTTIQLTTVFVSTSNSVPETTDPAIVVLGNTLTTNTDTKATTTASIPIAETTTAATVTPTPVLETTPVIESTSVIETAAAVIETTSTTIPVEVTTSTPLVIVTTITTTIL